MYGKFLNETNGGSQCDEVATDKPTLSSFSLASEFAKNFRQHDKMLQRKKQYLKVTSRNESPRCASTTAQSMMI